MLYVRENDLKKRFVTFMIKFTSWTWETLHEVNQSMQNVDLVLTKRWELAVLRLKHCQVLLVPMGSTFVHVR
jgi:hypothetical protein